MKKGVLTMLVILGLAASAGCGSKVTCKTVNTKNTKCNDALSAAMLDYTMDKVKSQTKARLAKLPPEAQKKAMEAARAASKKQVDAMMGTLHGDAFMKLCKKNGFSAAEKKSLGKCMKKDCKGYAACFVDAVIKAAK
ncbi:MAG: hypothetical protein J7M25_00735 [Deltaproteobacteria bacterium]|nr:hypothetical protein [Deltaproteobacteria bacterium]